MPSPPLKVLKKVIANRRRSSEAQSDTGVPPPRPGSIESFSLDKSPTRQSTHSSPSRDGSSKSGSSGVRKLLPGHSKRRRRRQREEELKNAAEDVGGRGRPAALPSPPAPLSRKASSLGSNSLLTDDSEVESAPPLASRDSHTGYLTTTSPLVKSATVPELNDAAFENNQALPHTQTLPSMVEPQRPEHSPSPKSPFLTDIPSLPSPVLFDKADTLRPDSRSGSVSKIRSKSPARKFRDVFSSKSKSPRTSPERKSMPGFTSPLSRNSTVLTNDTEDVPPSRPVPVDTASAAAKSMPALDTDPRPMTPPTSLISTPVTTVTPPTPTDTRFDVPASPRRSDTDSSNSTIKPDNVTVSPSGMISHRRVRSGSSISHQPSKLSNSITAPLTPTIEETRTPSGSSIAGGNGRTASGNFFSSWMTAAQTAATTFTNLTSQNRSRAGTVTSESSQKGVDPIKEESEADEPETPRKQLAVETMGAGDLNFEHLGLEQGTSTPVKPSLAELRHDSVVARDVASAKAEDVLAKRAVSAAYARSNDATPVAEVPDPLNNLTHTPTFSTATGQATPPNGSILESEVASVKRANSVRSKIAKRRSRGSSVATGQSAIGALIGGSTATLANPATGPRLSGFSMAPKQRNRTFHQQFRSVPEDDFLVEDYSCALQKEILLAGRVYISEGHICFSSNILGWVTTLVISFEEIVNIEKENTALVIPNAIAIQTLHARHTFRSLLSREYTYDLLIGIWKVSHPASFQKSIAGKQIVAEEATKNATGTGTSEKGSEKASEGSTEEDSDEDDDDDSAPSIIGSGASVAGSEMVDVKSLSRKPSGMNGLAPATVSGAATNGEIVSTVAAVQGTGDPPQDFPGPATHAPTECNDASTHYDIIVKDEVLPAPLGKIYGLLYGPQSTSTFLRKFLVDECKSLDLQLEDDKKGLSNEKKSRQYTYIKPLGGSIGPKQTKCITTEELDFFDLERAVTVTCSTQTPDVPSGNAFVTKTRYCLTWAAGNATRFQMNCTIEWSAKSWLKNPIEKGAKEGQQQYGDTLVKSLKAQVGRARGMTSASKVSKGKRKGKRSKKEKAEAEKAEEIKREENWGLFEPLRGYLGPVVDIARPVLKMEYVVGVLFFMVLIIWFSKPKVGALSPYAALSSGQRMAAYEEMWRKEEGELWNWLEHRAGVDAVTLQKTNTPQTEKDEKKEQRSKQKQRQKVLKGKDVEARLREEKMSEREMEEALRVTRERLEVLEDVVKKRRHGSAVSESRR